MGDVPQTLLQLLAKFYWALPIHAWGKPNPAPNAGLWGDLDDVELVQALEDHFEISVSDEETQATKTLGQMQDLLRSKRPDLSDDDIWRDLCRITSDIGNGKAHEYTRETMFLSRI